MRFKLSSESAFSPLKLPQDMSGWMLAIGMFFSSLTNFIDGIYKPGVSDKIYVGEVFFALAAILGLAQRMVKKERLLLCWPLWVSAILMTTSFLANFYQNVPADDIAYLVAIIGTCVLPQLYLFLRIRDSSELRFHIYCMCLGVVVGAVFTVAFCNGFIRGHEDLYWQFNNRSRGLTFHPNALGVYTALAFPGLLLMFIEFKSWFIRGAVLLMAWCAWLAIGYSGSRTAVYTVMLMAVISYLLMFGDIPKRSRVKMVFLPFLALPIAMVLQASSSSQKYSAIWRIINGQVGSDVERVAIKQKAWADFYDSPFFGAGFQYFRYSHNIFLEMLHSSGAVGFIGSTLALFLPFVLIYRFRQQKMHEWTFSQRCTVSCLITAAIGVIICGLAQLSSSGYFLGVPFGFLLYVAAHRLTDEQVLVPHTQANVIPQIATQNHGSVAESL